MPAVCCSPAHDAVPADNAQGNEAAPSLTDAEQIVVVLTLPKERGLKQSLGRWLKQAGRAHGCRCVACWPIEAEPPTWVEFRGKAEGKTK